MPRVHLAGDVVGGILINTTTKVRSSGVPVIVHGDPVVPHFGHPGPVTMIAALQKLKVAGKWATKTSDIATCLHTGPAVSKINIS